MVANAEGATSTVATDLTGSYVVRGLPPGRYMVSVSFPGFALYENPAVDLIAGRTTRLPVLLNIEPIKEEITLRYEPTSFHRGTVVLPGSDFEGLPEDPDDLATDLEALAGASAAPQGTQIFVDGFTSARLPPKASIREFRTNSNPFSAINDKVGFGRIEVFTKPGSDKFRGQLLFNFGHGAFNSRNPFYAWDRPLLRESLYGASFGGPLSKRASFTLDFETRGIGTGVVVNATFLDAAMNAERLRRTFDSPQQRTTVTPRLDYEVNQNHTLVGRYTSTRIGRDNAGIGDFSLPSRAYSTSEIEHAVQLTETAVLSSRVLNETRIQFVRSSLDQAGNGSVPTLNVGDAFIGGGTEIGHSLITQNRWEIQNSTYYRPGRHTLRWGTRVRTAAITEISPLNFGGTFRFSVRSGPELDADNQIVRDAAGQPVVIPVTALEAYRRTLLFQGQGLTAAQIRALGGGASQFTLTAGNARADVSQVDVGVFLQDDWRVRQNFTLSLGLRYELQNNIHSWKNLAPRVSFALAPGGPNKKKTALRFGFGIFYDRFSERLTLQAIRLNGLNQQQYSVRNPDFFPLVPAVETIKAQQLPTSIRRVADELTAPYLVQTSIGIEHLLPLKMSVMSTFTSSIGMDLLRSRNVNAPLPGTYIPGVSTSGIRPYGPGTIFEYESTGTLRQNQWNTNVTSRFHPKLTLFALYVLNFAKSNTDGPTTFPADPYDDSADYGRSVLDERYRFVMGASIAAPWGVQVSPFVVARSGTPYNITTGTDLNGDTLLTERPAFASDPSRPGLVVTRFGLFDPNPVSPQLMLERNYAQGSGYFTVNFRLSKTFGMGGTKKGPQPGGGGSGWKSILTDRLTQQPYNLTLAVSARNLLNKTNAATPVGTLTSPRFGIASSLANSYAPAPAAGNRRVEVQVRLKF